MNDLIAKRKNFGFETNLADNDTWKFIENIQLIGYQIIINFYCIDDVDTCINRVFNRVKEGGHFVRPDIVKMRYENGLKLLKYYFELPDYLILTNNSDAPIEFLKIEKGNIVYQENHCFYQCGLKIFCPINLMILKIKMNLWKKSNNDI
jgi:predicted ABC-type ATPase